MKILLVIIICLLAAGLTALFCALKALRRDTSSSRKPDSPEYPGSPEEDEATLRDIVRLLDKLEKRVDVLETLLEQHAEAERGSASSTTSLSNDDTRR